MSLDVAAWPGLRLAARVLEGNRNEVWRGSIDGRAVSIRQSRRTEPSLDWELDLIAHLDSLGFTVPTVVAAGDGSRHVGRVVVQRWLDGHAPVSTNDWHLVAVTLQQLHRATVGYRQRPGCCAVSELLTSSLSVDADMAAMPPDVAREVLGVFGDVASMPVSVIHGDPTDANIRIGADGTVGLLDFDESRVDVAWHDLSNLGVQVLDEDDHRRALRLSDAWETANAWVAEPAYALTRLAALRAARS
jgi:Ser/Thr protein kinase RdoA (MazF antagonist)